MRQNDKVLLPEPLGPMSAWTSPALTVRVRPLRISLPSTDTCRFSTSKSGVLMYDSFVVFQGKKLPGANPLGQPIRHRVLAPQQAGQRRLVQEALNVRGESGPHRADAAVAEVHAGVLLAGVARADVVGGLHVAEGPHHLPKRRRGRGTVQHVAAFDAPAAVHQ